MEELPNVEALIGYVPEEVKGDKKVNALVVKRKSDGEERELAVDGVFVEAGGIPNNSYLPEDVKTNSMGEIITNKDGETKNKQIIIAVGEGAAAALAAHDYLLRSGK